LKGYVESGNEKSKLQRGDASNMSGGQQQKLSISSPYDGLQFENQINTQNLSVCQQLKCCIRASVSGMGKNSTKNLSL
jgi:hypothetical protein